MEKTAPSRVCHGFDWDGRTPVRPSIHRATWIKDRLHSSAFTPISIEKTSCAYFIQGNVVHGRSRYIIRPGSIGAIISGFVAKKLPPPPFDGSAQWGMRKQQQKKQQQQKMDVEHGRKWEWLPSQRPWIWGAPNGTCPALAIARVQYPTVRQNSEEKNNTQTKNFALFLSWVISFIAISFFPLLIMK